MTKSRKSFAVGLVSNIFIIGIGSALTKLLLFALLPILTHELTPEEYGINELLTNSVNLALPIFSLVIFEAILRYTMDLSVNKEDVLKVGIRITSFGSVVLGICAIFVSFFYKSIFVIIFFIGLYVVSAYKNCFVYYARGKNKFTLITVISITEVIVLLVIVLLQIYYAKLTLIGYILGNLLSSLLCDILYVIFLKIRFLDLLNLKDRELERSMIKYSAPMVFNSLGWWLNNVSDRYMLTYFCSLSLTGIYSVSYKIPGILNTIVDVFMQAWKVSATEKFESGHTKHYSKGYEAFVYASFMTCAILLVVSRKISFLFGTAYKTSWKYSVILIIAFLFNGISGYLGTIFTAMKQTKYIGNSTIIGALVNVLLNLILIPNFAAMGAAIATMLSNIVIWGIRGYFVKKYIEIRVIKPIFILFICLLTIETVFVVLDFNSIYSFFCAFIIALLNLIMFLRKRKF